MVQDPAGHRRLPDGHSLGSRPLNEQAGYVDVVPGLAHLDRHPLRRLGDPHHHRGGQPRPDETAPGQTLIELVHQPLPDLEPDNLTSRLEAAATLDPLNGGWPTTLLGCTASPGNWTTTTEDSAIGHRIGLHGDDFDRLPYPKRPYSRRRLCLSLGPGTRYLLIGDHDVQHICRALYRDLDHHYPHITDVRRYVAAGHRLRCLRLRLDPGDGYIAPTELLPLDGSTLNSAAPSVAAFWLGRQPEDHEVSLP
ncbi:hypothetical protein [Streptomyces sp. BK205]|uniref:hypothetical protein n=1 Tax=Streptomyces sp. BK205 TaxID=2512164 RepID=UPI00104B5D57|nr:hypothetical protein [Streptomyces sp. BK205]TCR22946.1 hypothetical protein EV578_104276 [Streptomyces sp. BK205]